MDKIINLFTKDPIIAVAGVICVISLILIVILSFLYKKLKDEQLISELVSAVETHQHTKEKTKPALVKPQASQQKTTHQDIASLAAQLSELSSQINNLNKHIQEISKTISLIKELKPTETVESVSEATLVKLVNIVEKLSTEINAIKTVDITTEIKEINNKLNDLLKLISTKF